jgi:PST family polysaccharide transporter
LSNFFNENIAEAGHGRRSLRSGAVVVGARALIASIQVVTILFLARLLTPEDYGLVSMVTFITAFAPLLVSLGTPDAVVQRAKITERDIGALLWINVGLGLGAAIVMAACGPLIAQFYREPRLSLIASVSSLSFIAAALTCQHYALLRRAMRFEELAIIDVGANALSALVAIAMAFVGLEYWALVVRPVLLASLVALGVWARCRWIPPRPSMTPAAKEMLGLGLHSAGFSITDFIGRASDRVAIGYRSGAVSLGYYQNAMFIYDNLLDLLVAPLHGVAVASLSKVRDNLAELHRLWRKALLTLAFVAMPAFGVLAVTSQDLVVLLLGAKWSHAGFLLAILALRGIPHSVERTLGWLHVAAGRTDRWMRWGIVATVVQLAALFCGLPFGPTGVSVAFVVAMFILFVPAVAYSGMPLGIGAGRVMEAIWRPLVGSLVATGGGFALRYTLLADMAAIPRTGVLALSYLIIYLGIVVGLLGVTMPVRVLLTLLHDALPARWARWVRTPTFLKGRD